MRANGCALTFLRIIRKQAVAASSHNFQLRSYLTSSPRCAHNTAFTFSFSIIKKMLYIFTADTVGLGRVDASTLCDQQMLELFFVSETANVLWDERDEDDACTWRGIQCGDTDEIRSIVWTSDEGLSLIGSIEFAMMPKNLVQINLQRQNVTGAIDVRVFPESLQLLCIILCGITGTLDLRCLPPGMKRFFVQENAIQA